MKRLGSVTAGRLSALLPLGLFVGSILLMPAVRDGSRLWVSWPWVPSLGVNAAFALDGLSLLFALIISGVGIFIVLFAADYMAGQRHYGRFFTYLHLFLLAMLGLVLADNLLTLFVFWELTTLLSYLLIGFDHESQTARDHGRQALLVTGSGGLALLIGFLLLGDLSGTYRISELTGQAQTIQAHGFYPAIVILVFLGCFTKSAQFPFHFWLPNAMAAPTPISAFLHSATMVKAGIYLLARMHPILGGTPLWMGSLVIIGGITALLGAVSALGQSDLKRVLAYTTLMALGILTMFLGGQTTPALTAAITFLLVHSLYKSALFMVAGSIDHATGTRDLTRLGGLLKSMPLTALGTAAAALSMSGFPLFLGFIGKEIMYKGALTEDLFPLFATTAAVISNALMAAVAGILIVQPFLRAPRSTPRRPHEVSFGMWLGPVALGLVGFIFGIIPDWVGQRLVQPAVAAFHPSVETIQLKLFHGINEPLLLSILTLTLGLCAYLGRRTIYALVAAASARLPLGAERVYEGTLHATAWLASALTRRIQNGSLHCYLVTIVSVLVLTAGSVWIWNSPEIAIRVPPPPSLPFTQWLLAGLMAMAVLVVIGAYSRVLAVAALGLIGSGAALIFLQYGAPDLALTQLMIETLTLIIVSMVLLRLPPLERPPRRGGAARWADALVALGAGGLVAGLTLAVCAGPLDRQLTAFFEANSWAKAHGRNIVNVILVDFRGLDTLGEIVVVATAGLAGFGLLAKRKGKKSP